MSSENSSTEQRYVYVGYHGKENPTERERLTQCSPLRFAALGMARLGTACI